MARGKRATEMAARGERRFFAFALDRPMSMGKKTSSIDLLPAVVVSVM